MLDTQTAEKAVFDLLEDQATRTDNLHLAHRAFARELVRIVAELVRSADVTGSVATTGTATAQTGTILNAHLV